MESVVRLCARAAILIACLLVTGSPAAAQSVAASGDRPKDQSWTISGKVVLAGKPAAGVTVVAIRREDYSPIARARTDEAGHYQLTGLTGGEYDVTAFAPVFVPANPTPSLSNKSIIIKEGETAEGLDFEMVRGGVITGTITGPDGQPLIGEIIGISRVDDDRSFIPADQSGARSDDRGVYRIYGVPPGQYMVSVRPGHFQRTYYPGVTDQARATAVEIGPDSETNVNMAVGAPVKRYAAVGRAIDADTRKPAPNASFDFKCIEGEEPGLTGSGYATDSNGEFRIDSLAPGRYLVSVDRDRDYYGDPLVFEVTDQELTGLELRFHRGAVVTGIAVIEGVDQPEVMSKLADLSLDARIRTSNVSASWSKLGLIGLLPDGSFRIGGLRPGALDLYLNDSGSSGSSIARVEVNGVDHRAEGISVADGSQITGVRLVLTYGSGTIRGRIKIQGGSLPPDVIMYVAAELVSDYSRSLGQSRVSAGGMFEIGGLIDGEYELIVFARNAPQGLKVTVTNGEAPFTVVNLDLNPQPGNQK